MVSIGTLGINHKTANLALREAIARAAEHLRGEKAIFFGYPTVLLSTCNRTEIYFSGEDLAEIHSELLALLRSHLKVPFEHRLYSYFGVDCFAHLCRVTAGIDSAIFAETEIQRQVKLAYGNSKYLSKCLHYAFQKALKVGKNVRSKMHLQKNPTLYNTLWQFANWKEKRVLLVGYSEINRGLLSYLEHKGVKDLTLCTREPKRIQHPSVRITSREVLKHWQRFDLIVCASKSDGYLIRGKGSSKHIIFDLSVPRGVDPKTEARVINIEELNHRIQQKRSVVQLEESLDFIWENVIRLTQIYRMKLLLGQEASYKEKVPSY